jgi:hypothetical protein
MTTMLRDSQRMAGYAILLYEKLRPQIDVLREHVLAHVDEEKLKPFFEGAVFGIVTGEVFSQMGPNVTLREVLPIAALMFDYLDEFYSDGVDHDDLCKELVPDAFVEKPKLRIAKPRSSKSRSSKPRRKKTEAADSLRAVTTWIEKIEKGSA